MSTSDHSKHEGHPDHAGHQPSKDEETLSNDQILHAELEQILSADVQSVVDTCVLWQRLSKWGRRFSRTRAGRHLFCFAGVGGPLMLERFYPSKSPAEKPIELRWLDGFRRSTEDMLAVARAADEDLHPVHGLLQALDEVLDGEEVDLTDRLRSVDLIARAAAEAMPMANPKGKPDPHGKLEVAEWLDAHKHWAEMSAVRMAQIRSAASPSRALLVTTQPDGTKKLVETEPREEDPETERLLETRSRSNLHKATYRLISATRAVVPFLRETQAIVEAKRCARQLNEYGLHISNLAGEGLAPTKDLLDQVVELRWRIEEATRIAREGVARPRPRAATRQTSGSPANEHGADVGQPTTPITPPETERPMMIREGGVWTIRFAGADCTVRDLKGFHYVQQLVSQPNEPIDVTELYGGAPILLAARQEAKDRDGMRDLAGAISDTELQLEEAQRNNDQGGVEAAQRELHQLNDELRALHSIRSSEPADERSRLRGTVGKSIQSAIAALESLHPTAHQHLTRSIVTPTGYTPCYSPSEPTTWLVNNGSRDKPGL